MAWAARSNSAESPKLGAGARHHGHPRLHGQFPGSGLFPHQLHGSRRRSDEADSPVLAAAGKFGVFGQKPVTGVDGFRPAGLGRLQDPVHIQVALHRRRSPQAISLVGQAHVQRRTVAIRVHRHGCDIHLPGGSNDPDRNFTPVGNQNLREHGHRQPRRVSGAGPRKPPHVFWRPGPEGNVDRREAPGHRPRRPPRVEVSGRSSDRTDGPWGIEPSDRGGRQPGRHSPGAAPSGSPGSKELEGPPNTTSASVERRAVSCNTTKKE